MWGKKEHMAVKVADLIEDLETGDRSMEHLKKPEPTPESVASEVIRAMEALAGVPQGLVGGFMGGSLLGGIAQQQSAFNQAANQQLANQQAFGMQAMYSNNTASSWNR